MVNGSRVLIDSEDFTLREPLLHPNGFLRPNQIARGCLLRGKFVAVLAAKYVITFMYISVVEFTFKGTC